jgi:putative DNA primase/helicase
VILEAHAHDLAASGLANATILDNGIYSANGAECSALLGFGVGPGLVFPYDRAGANGKPTYARVKLDHAGVDGKRYRSPRGRGNNHLYIPFTANPRALCDVTRLLVVTEGEKKCLRATQEGLICVGLSGVWSWRHRPVKGAPSVPIDDLHVLPWRHRQVVIVFDSDAATKEDVRAAELALAEEPPAEAPRWESNGYRGARHEQRQGGTR